MVILCAIAVATAAGPAHAGKKARRHNNMPDGWSWPPTAGMMRAGRACLARLDQLGVRWRKGPKARKIATPVVVPGMELGGIRLVSVYRKPPHVMDCQLAAALAEQGPALYEAGVREIHFSSLYRYTRVRTGGKQLRALSRHALGLAIDIRHLVDDAGVAHSIADDYLNDDELLLSVEGLINDSGGFRLVLTPANDPESHDDHFHFEAKADYSQPPPVQARSGPDRSQRAKKQARSGSGRSQRAKKQARRR
jgi:hypothetical protein